MRGANNPMDTINAAATAIASAENRGPHASVQKRRWRSFLNISWCFGSQKHSKRIGHATLVPEPSSSRTETPVIQNPSPPSIMLPFIAPPSSPASFFQSDPSSLAQSPTGVLSFTSVAASMYSPGPASMFAIGPYAHETQLVSPPVFSTFTTEPSTAPFTPPPESVHLTTPSSPEVPFARLLGPSHPNGEVGQRFSSSHYEFQSYQLYPGSPVGHLISPSSGISYSGTSSPFPDGEFARGGGPHFLEFPTSVTTPCEWESREASGTLTPEAAAAGPMSRDGVLLDRQNSDLGPLASFANVGGRNDESIADHRVSFEITAEEVVSCVEKRRIAVLANGCEHSAGETSENTSERASVDGEDGGRHNKHRSTTTLGSVKEFNFDSTDGVDAAKPSIATDWWNNEKVLGKDKNWSFFPMMQPGVS